MSENQTAELTEVLRVRREKLQALIGADRLVAFGDNSNDLPLFAAADVACCVASGRPDARAAADVIVAGNNDDGVARYLAALPELA